MKQILMAGGALILSMGVACAQTNGNSGANGNNNVFSGHTAGPANNNVFSGHNAGPANNNVFSGHDTPGNQETAQKTAMNNTGNTSGNSSANSNGGRMSNSQIEAKLRTEGYNSFTHVRDQNGWFTANARRYGKSINGLKASEKTGQVQNQNKLNDQQVKVLLAESGYKDIAKVNNSNNHTMTAKAKKNGVEHVLYINSLTGHITQKS